MSRKARLRFRKWALILGPVCVVYGVLQIVFALLNDEWTATIQGGLLVLISTVNMITAGNIDTTRE